MFSTPLIEDAPRYYSLTRRQWLLSFLISIPLALAISFSISPDSMSWWIIGPAIAAYVGLAIWMKKTQNNLGATTSEHTLVLDETTVTVQDRAGKASQTYDLSNVDRILLKEAYGIPGETLADLWRELRGKPKRNYLILEQAGNQHQLHFLIDSYYGLKQLDRLIEEWSRRGYRLQRQ